MCEPGCDGEEGHVKAGGGCVMVCSHPFYISPVLHELFRLVAHALREEGRREWVCRSLGKDVVSVLFSE